MRILESWGVEYVIMPDFAQVAEWPAERFANLLRFGLNAKRIACGADFRFGKFVAEKALRSPRRRNARRAHSGI